MATALTSLVAKVCYSYTDNLELAVQYLEQALELHKHDVTFLQLGKVLLQRGDVEKVRLV